MYPHEGIALQRGGTHSAHIRGAVDGSLYRKCHKTLHLLRCHTFGICHYYNCRSREVGKHINIHLFRGVYTSGNHKQCRQQNNQSVFDWGTDIFKARQIVSEKMVALGESLPEGITPTLAPQSSVMGEILFIGLQSDSTSMMELRTLADWVIKPAILATGGVSQVTNIGGELKQYQILADPQKMDFYGVTMEELEEVGKSFSVNSVGGVIRDYGNEYALRGMGRTTDLEALGSTLVKTRNGKPVVLSDVAEVKTGAAVRMGNASQNGKPAVILSVSKQPNINTLEVTEQIEENLEAIKKSLPSDVRMDTKIFRQADLLIDILHIYDRVVDKRADGYAHSSQCHGVDVHPHQIKDYTASKQ